MDLAQAQYSFGDHAYRRFVERIKDAVDPNGILSPRQAGDLAEVLPGSNGQG
jgi:4-cresol dehydrogenase (hydroxylating)